MQQHDRGIRFSKEVLDDGRVLFTDWETRIEALPIRYIDGKKQLIQNTKLKEVTEKSETVEMVESKFSIKNHEDALGLAIIFREEIDLTQFFKIGYPILRGNELTMYYAVSNELRKKKAKELLSNSYDKLLPLYSVQIPEEGYYKPNYIKMITEITPHKGEPMAIRSYFREKFTSISIADDFEEFKVLKHAVENKDTDEAIIAAILAIDSIVSSSEKNAILYEFVSFPFQGGDFTLQDIINKLPPYRDYLARTTDRNKFKRTIEWLLDNILRGLKNRYMGVLFMLIAAVICGFLLCTEKEYEEGSRKLREQPPTSSIYEQSSHMLAYLSSFTNTWNESITFIPSMPNISNLFQGDALRKDYEIRVAVNFGRNNWTANETVIGEIVEFKMKFDSDSDNEIVEEAKLWLSREEFNDIVDRYNTVQDGEKNLRPYIGGKKIDVIHKLGNATGAEDWNKKWSDLGKKKTQNLLSWDKTDKFGDPIIPYYRKKVLETEFENLVKNESKQVYENSIGNVQSKKEKNILEAATKHFVSKIVLLLKPQAQSIETVNPDSPRIDVQALPVKETAIDLIEKLDRGFVEETKSILEEKSHKPLNEFVCEWSSTLFRFDNNIKFRSDVLASLSKSHMDYIKTAALGEIQNFEVLVKRLIDEYENASKSTETTSKSVFSVLFTVPRSLIRSKPHVWKIHANYTINHGSLGFIGVKDDRVRFSGPSPEVQIKENVHYYGDGCPNSTKPLIYSSGD